MPDGVQIHHILPQQSPIVIDAFQRLGLDVVNYAPNRIALPSSNNLATAMRLPKHAGNHSWNGYRDFVEARVEGFSLSSTGDECLVP